MKKTLIAFAALLWASQVFCQVSSESREYFGKKISTDGATSVKKLPAKMKNDEDLEIKLKGTITEVCQAKGCWMTLDMGNDELLRVKFADYGFFVPKDAAGKKAVIDGVARKETIGIDELQHLAKDAGKPEEEIRNIQQPSEEFVFVADGVIIQ